MSTILKALRRLEDERSAQPERPLREQVASGPESARGGRRWLVLIVAGVLGLGTGAGALLFWPPGEPETASVGEPVTITSTPPRPERAPAPAAPRRAAPDRNLKM